VRLSDSAIEAIHEILSKKILKHTVTILIFSCLYVGVENASFILYAFLFYFAVILYSTHKGKKIEEDAEIGELLTNNQVVVGEHNGGLNKLIKRIEITFESISQDVQESKEKIKNGEYLQFLSKKVGFMLVFLSLALGVGRADFVKDNVHVKLEGSEVNLVLYLTTSSGIGLYDVDRKTVIFTSWDNVKDMELLPEKRRSYQ